MIGKNDLYEMYPAIVRIRERQQKTLKLAKILMQEVEGMEDQLNILEAEYKLLKKKAGEK